MNTNEEPREAGVRALAIVGFIALVGAGMWLAVYSAQYVPNAVNRLGAAAVALTSVFHSGGNNTLSIVPTTTPSFNEGTSTTDTSSTTTPLFPIAPQPVDDGSVTPTPTPTPTPTTPAHVATPTPGPKTSTTTQVSGSTSSPSAPYGLPDLVTSIISPGYMTTTSTDSFIASTTVPLGSRAAVKFVIRNAGTGIAAPWRFSAAIPTFGSYLYQSQQQQSLNPGDSIEYTLGFDSVTRGSQTITITANYDRQLSESNMNDDVASATITVPGQ